MSPKPGAFPTGALLNNTIVNYVQTAAFGGPQLPRPRVVVSV